MVILNVIVCVIKMSKKINFQSLIIQASKFIFLLFIISIIATFFYCKNNPNDWFCFLWFFYIFGQPLVMIVDLFLPLHLDKLIFFDSNFFDTNIFFVLSFIWFLMWLGIAWVYTKVMANKSFFKFNVSKVMIFLIDKIVVSLQNYLC